MRSYDQFSNIVLEDTHERHFVGGELMLCMLIVFRSLGCDCAGSTLNWRRRSLPCFGRGRIGGVHLRFGSHLLVGLKDKRREHFLSKL